MSALIIPLLMAAISTSPPAAPSVQAATGDWSNLPALQVVSYANLNSSVMAKLYAISRHNRCKLPGQYGSHINMTLSFAAQFSPNGRLSRLLVPQMNCPEAESWLGGALVQSIEHGDFRPNPAEMNQEGWYRGDFSFSYEG